VEDDVRPANSWDPAITLLAAFGGAIILTGILAFEGGTRRLDVDLVPFALLAAAVAFRSRAVVVPGVIGIAWFYYSGFLVNRHGELLWHGTVDGWRLATIAVGGFCGSLLSRVLRFAVSTYGSDGRTGEVVSDRVPEPVAACSSLDRIPDYVPEHWLSGS
jgi:hypothetical protein